MRCPRHFLDCKAKDNFFLSITLTAEGLLLYPFPSSPTPKSKEDKKRCFPVLQAKENGGILIIGVF